jgi:hypothetical protein
VSEVVDATDEIVDVQVTELAPYFDVEVLSDPHLDGPEPVGGNGYSPDQLASLRSDFVARVETLRRQFGGQSLDGLLVACGNAYVETPRAVMRDEREFWDSALDHVIDRLGRHERPPALITLPGRGDNGAAEPYRRVFRISITGEAEADPEPFALLAVVAFPSVDAPLDEVERFVRELATGPERNTPLYLVGVVHGDAVAGESVARSEFLRRCQAMRMSLLLAGGLESAAVPTVSAIPLRTGQGASALTIVPCPTFKRGVGTPGMARVRIDVWRGDAEVAFRYDLGSDRPVAPVQVGHPLASVSRVRASERRLYSRVHKILRASEGQNPDFVRTFRGEVRTKWDETGYATLSEPAGRFGGLEERLQKRYFLLLLIRERPGGGYDLLLNHHTPMRQSSLADWNTLLFPAFTQARDLLERLHNDVMRHAVERTEDLGQAERARDFSDAVKQFIEADTQERDGLWRDQIREIAQMKMRKISPTDGCVTEFEYHLVTLLPLVERPDAADADDENGHRDLARRIIAFLDGLAAVTPEGADGMGPGDISIEALGSAGAGLRWNPEVELVSDPNAAERRRAEKLPPGAVWFPLDDKGVPMWKRCPAIESRNGDVMSWVQKQLADRLQEDGRFPPQLVLGQAAPGPDTYRVVEQLPFAAKNSGESTCSALRKVRFHVESDLRRRHAYPAAKTRVRRVVLLRRPSPVASDRDEIAVFDVDELEAKGLQLPDIRPRSVRKIEPLGRLRPVQRYVLVSGLKRAAEIQEQVLPDFEDPWGFVRMQKGNAPKPVALTPPIIESLHSVDREGTVARDEFVLCDGNHRVVQTVWNDERPMAAVAVTGRLPEPYYARPFGVLEWDVTAGNELFWAPEQASKYVVRKVDREKLSARAQKVLERKRDDELYRRYYRDLETGFGYMGGQGGAFA